MFVVDVPPTGHIETGPRLNVSSDRPVKRGIEPATPGLQGKWFIHYTRLLAPIYPDQTDRIGSVGSGSTLIDFWLVGFVALRPKSTAMVIAGRSVHLTTLFSWAGLNKRLTSNLCTYFRL